MSIKQNLNQSLDFKLSPSQIQLITLLKIPNIMLESKLKEEVEKNIVLEFDEPQTEHTTSQDNYENNELNNLNADESTLTSADELKYQANEFVPEFEDKRFINLKASKNIYDLLMEQIGAFHFTEQEFFIAEYIIGSLDQDGLLHRPMSIIIDDLLLKYNLEINEETFKKVLTAIQNLEPAGIATTSLQECLLAQLEKMIHQHFEDWMKIAKIILVDYYEAFIKKSYAEIIKKINISKDELELVIQKLAKLNPHPGNFLKETDTNKEIIYPDFIISLQQNKLSVELTKNIKPKVKINEYYKNLFLKYSKDDKTEAKEATRFLKDKIQQAEQLIGNLKSRDDILLDTMKLIVEKQKDFFMTGNEVLLKPLILQNIADPLKISISSVSRIVNSKFIQTDYGIFSLKHFFVENYENEFGDTINPREIKQLIKEIIEHENKTKPFTDEQIITQLKKKNYHLTRRTIANYRNEMNIQTSKMRKFIIND